MTANRNRIFGILIGGLLALGSLDVWAAKAPLSPEELKKEASQIISGEVIKVTSKVQKSEIEKAWGVHRDRVFTIKLKVKTVAKGTGIKTGSEIKVTAWQPATRIPPLPGLQGHESIPEKGDTVTVYVKAKKGKAYEPILPNGIVIENDSSDGHCHETHEAEVEEELEAEPSTEPESKGSLSDAIFGAMLGAIEEDDFADNLTIPSDIEVTDPLDVQNHSFGNSGDTFQQDLLSALASPGTDDPTITADLTSLLKLHRDSPDLLMRLLVTSPEWRVFKERGNIFATRRWVIRSQWKYEGHGYYSRFDIHTASGSDIPNFQSRFTIGFSGQSWARAFFGADKMDVGETSPLALSSGNGMHESRCVIKGDDLMVEVFEQSGFKERRLTKAALAHVEKELAPLVDKPNWKTARDILPAGSIKQGEPTFDLWNISSPGIYDSEIWINPGEPGMLYLKAFEVTKGTPLSVGRLDERSSEWVGWSDNPDELFFSNTNFTIYEGDWGKPYAARFEVWFTPDSGAKDRKLIENVFKIEGWER